MTEVERDRGMGWVTSREAQAARTWLAKRGAPVSSPRTLLAVRLGTRSRRRHWFRYYLAFVVVGIVLSFGYQSLQVLPDVHGKDMTDAVSTYFILCAIQLATWRTWLRVDRELAIRVGPAARPRQPWWKPLGGWYLAALAVTFAGGAALAVVMFVTTPARTYAWSWLGLLAVGALSTAVVLTSVLRAPVIADDDATRAVDDLVRGDNADGAFPAMFAALVVFDLFEGLPPPGFTWPLIGYVLLSLGLQAVGTIQHARRKLPPGDYGVPIAESAAESTAK